MGGPSRLKLLLDTHIWLWGLREPNRLVPRILSELRDTRNEIWLSPISTWEALLLHTKGKIRLTVDLVEWLRESTAGMREAPLTHEIVLVAQQLKLHQDPADRFLAATAMVFGLTLVTADERLLELGNIPTLANR
jgi:PIN domain nuclease of toxin-antitoxin system